MHLETRIRYLIAPDIALVQFARGFPVQAQTEDCQPVVQEYEVSPGSVHSYGQSAIFPDYHWRPQDGIVVPEYYCLYGGPDFHKAQNLPAIQPVQVGQRYHRPNVA